MSRARRIRTLEGRMTELARDLEALKIEPAEPIGDPFAGDPPVIYFTKNFGGTTEFTYAAIKAAGRWWVTGKTLRSFTWEELLDFADTGVRTMSEATQWRTLEPRS